MKDQLQLHIASRGDIAEANHITGRKKTNLGILIHFRLTAKKL